MYTIRLVKSTACLLLENEQDSTNYIDYQFINKYSLENGLITESELLQEVKQLAERNSVIDYTYIGAC